VQLADIKPLLVKPKTKSKKEALFLFTEHVKLR